MNKALFQLELKHSYFNNNVLQGCQLRAHKQTQSIINRFSLISTMENGTYSLYATYKTNTVEFLEYINVLFDKQPFEFTLIFDAELFSLTTDLPLNWVGQIELSSKNIQPKNVANKPFEISPVLAPRSVFMDNAIANIIIHPEDIISFGGEQARYVVSFKSRKTQWLYYLINRSQTKLQNPVVTNNEGIEFDGPEAFTTTSGETGVFFSSGDQHFLMQESPREIFDLVDRISSSMNLSNEKIEKVIIQGLPTPQNSQLNILGENPDEPVSSTMYVYL